MELTNPPTILSRLLELRGKLRTALSSEGKSEDISDLIQEVNLALGQLTEGSYGPCETCRGLINDLRRPAGNLARIRLRHLTICEQRLLEIDLDLAWQVQRRLLPANGLEVGGWQTAYHYEAAGALSGDYCDLITPVIPRGGLYFFLGDVSGKGIAASILMSHLQGIFRSIRSPRTSISRLLEQANRLFSDRSPSTHFATIVAGKADPTGDVELCNAGHCQPLLASGGSVKMLMSTERPIGLFASTRFPTQRINLKSGDVLVLYSDGWTDARNEWDYLYGQRRLVRLVRRFAWLSAADLVQACLDDLERFRSTVPSSDDVTLLVLRRV